MSAKPAVSLVSDDMLDLLNNAKTVKAKPVIKKPGIVKKPEVSKSSKSTSTLADVKSKASNNKPSTNFSSKRGSSSSSINDKKPSLPSKRPPPSLSSKRLPPMPSFADMMKLASQNVQKLQSGELPTAPPPPSVSKPCIVKKPEVSKSSKSTSTLANVKSKVSNNKPSTNFSSESGSSSSSMNNKKPSLPSKRPPPSLPSKRLPPSLPSKRPLPPMPSFAKMMKLANQNVQKLQNGELLAFPPPPSVKPGIFKKPEMSKSSKSTSTLANVKLKTSNNKTSTNFSSKGGSSLSSFNDKKPSLPSKRLPLPMPYKRPPLPMPSKRPPPPMPRFAKMMKFVDEDEYDSMDDFIDDDVNEDYVPRNELNKVLRNFCRSDKDTWRRRERDIDIRGMEVGYRTIEAEDRKSSKIARFEDMLEEQHGARQLK